MRIRDARLGARVVNKHSKKLVLGTIISRCSSFSGYVEVSWDRDIPGWPSLVSINVLDLVPTLEDEAMLILAHLGD